MTPKLGMLLTEEEIEEAGAQTEWLARFARRIEAAVLNRWIAWLDTAEGDIDFVAFMMKKAAHDAEKEASDGE